MIINGKKYRTIWWENGCIKTIDQLKLPGKFEILEITNYNDAANSITTMIIRGAPAIGAMGAYGLALGIQSLDKLDWNEIQNIYSTLLGARPTAYDLTDGLNSVMSYIKNTDEDLSVVKEKAVYAANAYADKSVEACKKIGLFGKDLIKENSTVLTHCNAGALATVDYGTALSPMRFAHSEGKDFFVFVDETRPRLQGAMLTAWELGNEEIKHAVIADNAAGYYFQNNKIDLVITGTDRVARNGDIANKIGTYEKALLAHYHNVPVYIAAPFSTIDFQCPTGKDIPIEHRSEDEVLLVGGKRIAAEGSNALNPAFDITPAKFIKGIITEYGIIAPDELAKWENKRG